MSPFVAGSEFAEKPAGPLDRPGPSDAAGFPRTLTH
jgi:hypothetical protein